MRKKCNVEVDSTNFGSDPCIGVQKELTVYYICSLSYDGNNNNDDDNNDGDDNNNDDTDNKHDNNNNVDFDENSSKEYDCCLYRI